MHWVFGAMVLYFCEFFDFEKLNKNLKIKKKFKKVVDLVDLWHKPAM